jgi:sugar lactone lactonase YvrE
MVLRRIQFLLPALFGCALAACSAGANVPISPAAPASVARASRAHLYVANIYGNTVTVYTPATGRLIRTISEVHEPAALAFDPAGNLYAGSTPVVEFAAGSSTPMRTISDGDLATWAIALDAAANLYIANNGAICGLCSPYQTVAVYAPGSTAPLRTLRHLVLPLALAFDASGKLYVADGDVVAVYAAHGSKPERTIADGIDVAYALAFDSSGDLYVANIDNSTVAAYAPGATSPSRIISAGVRIPAALAFDATGNLYVANAKAGTVTVYAPGAKTVLRTIATGVVDPIALAFDDAGNLYVANAGSGAEKPGNVVVFAPHGTAPVRTISRGIDSPQALAFGP